MQLKSGMFVCLCLTPFQLLWLFLWREILWMNYIMFLLFIFAKNCIWHEKCACCQGSKNRKMFCKCMCALISLVWMMHQTITRIYRMNVKLLFSPALPSSSSDQDGPTDTRGLSLAAIAPEAWGNHRTCVFKYIISHSSSWKQNTLFIQSVQTNTHPMPSSGWGL